MRYVALEVAALVKLSIFGLAWVHQQLCDYAVGRRA